MIKNKEKTLDSLAQLGEHNSKRIDKFCALLIALGPFLQNYKGPIYNAGITALILVFLWLCVRLMGGGKISYSNVMFVLPHVCLFAYKVIAHGTTFSEIIQNVILITVYIAAAAKCINGHCVVKYAAIIAVVGCSGVILQTVCYYLFGFHITMAPVGLLTSHAEQWIGSLTTGWIGITGRRGSMYRPSGFFMEPSHISIYCFPILLLLLFYKNNSKKARIMAIIISLGCVLSTSGFGVFLVAGIWILFFASKGYGDKYSLKNIFRERNFITLGLCLVLVFVIYLCVPIVTKSVNRIFVENTFGTNAITGRTAAGMDLIANMSLTEWIFGVSDSMAEYTFNLSSFVSLAYEYGLLGLLLYYGLYARNVFVLKNRYFWINIIIVMLSFFSSHPHSMLTGLYYLMFLLDGYDKRCGVYGKLPQTSSEIKKGLNI